jgi:hypothetical protein
LALTPKVVKLSSGIKPGVEKTTQEPVIYLSLL